MNIFITGGCGYIGSVLTKTLLAKGHNVVVLDTQWFGNYLEQHSNLKIIKGDIRNIEKVELNQFDSIIHLANIANDPGVDLNPLLSWEVNVLATQNLADKASRAGVKHFLFASSGSVYGIKDEDKVTEDLDLLPISYYNKTKMVAERVLMSYQNKMKIHCIRPATVCGYSPRMRFDVTVNMFVLQAFKNKKITVFGGEQVRPNINIKDMVNVYIHFIDKKDSIDSGFFNAGFENLTIHQIAKKISKVIPSEIIISKSNDPRSYRQNSDKLIRSGFKKQFDIDDAINDLYEKLQSKKVEDNDKFYTVKWMKKLNL